MRVSLAKFVCMAAAAVLLFGAAPARAQDVLVFAAASLKNALDDIAAQFARETGKRARVSYAASSALARQIEAGAPADVFVSADVDWMEYLQQRSLIRPETRAELVANSIVLIAPKESVVTATIVPGFPLLELLGGGRLAMADVKAVPAGKYGKAALQTLGVWDSVRDKVAQAENVRAALALVSRGEAPLGIVYRTDAAADPNVRVVGAFPPETHPPVVYTVALTTASVSRDAGAFLAFLGTPAARAAFERQGFTVIAPPGRV